MSSRRIAHLSSPEADVTTNDVRKQAMNNLRLRRQQRQQERQKLKRQQTRKSSTASSLHTISTSHSSNNAITSTVTSIHNSSKRTPPPPHPHTPPRSATSPKQPQRVWIPSRKGFVVSLNDTLTWRMRHEVKQADIHQRGLELEKRVLTQTVDAHVSKEAAGRLKRLAKAVEVRNRRAQELRRAYIAERSEEKAMAGAWH